MKYDILLNFIPLAEQDFKFKVYRRENKGERKEQIGVGAYSNTLPLNHNNLDERTGYWIFFEEKEGFEEFICYPYYNHKLTQHYLYYCLANKFKRNLDHKSIIPKKSFRKIVYLILDEHPEGKECLLLSPYYLSLTKQFGFIVDFKFLKSPDVEFNRRIQQLSLSLDKNFRSNANFYIDKFQKLNLFKTNFYPKIFPLQVGDKNIALEDSFIKIPANTLKTKIYIVGRSQESKSQFMGIKDKGPYQSLNNEVLLSFFYRPEHKLFASDLARVIRGKGYATFIGIKDFFRIPEVKIEGIEIKDKDFEEAVIEVIKEKQSKHNYFIPVILTSRNENKEYYSIKYNSLKNQQPVQFVTLELLKNKESLKWSVSNIALQIFAKLGGIPWLMKAETKKTLIIGIGQSHEISTLNNKSQILKYFSYSVLTDSSGIYKELKVLGKSDRKDDYLTQLSGHIKNIVEQYSNDFDRFVIHAPFKIKRFELEKFKTIFENINLEKTFLVIRVNTKNKYFGFNPDANSLVPYESTLVQLSPNDYLIWFEGLQYHNPNINKRIAGPIHIEFYYCNRELTDDEKMSYLQDILNLAGANWRGFNAKSVPISIHYAQLVSKFVKYFSKFEDNEIENIRPWFL
jgi:hypothetical protein